MIDTALAFLAAQLDAHLQARAGTGPGSVVLARLVDDNGKWAISDDSVGVALINVRLDPVRKAAAAAVPGPGATPPAASFDLSVLFAAQSRRYTAALHHLAHVLTFFHEHPVFTRAQYPALGAGLEMLEVTLEVLDYEALAQVWTFIGGKQVPSVVYRVRLAAA